MPETLILESFKVILAKLSLYLPNNRVTKILNSVLVSLIRLCG